MADDIKFNQITLPPGKEAAIRTIFNHFKYVALGTANSPDNRKGFIMPVEGDNFLTDCAFNEVDSNINPSYIRPELVELEDSAINDNGRVTLSFACEIDTTNISEAQMVTLNQMVIVDNQTPNDINSEGFYASVFPDFEKNGNIAIEFTIEVSL